MSYDIKEIDQSIKRVVEIKKLLRSQKTRSTGIRVEGSKHVLIKDNRISGFDRGIEALRSEDVKAIGNQVTATNREMVLYKLTIIEEELQEMRRGKEPTGKLKRALEWLRNNAGTISTILIESGILKRIFGNP